MEMIAIYVVSTLCALVIVACIFGRNILGAIQAIGYGTALILIIKYFREICKWASSLNELTLIIGCLVIGSIMLIAVEIQLQRYRQ
ncbi:hypothetical protein [Fictibacillus sp. NRS-1165]|uniref:hypothetical protein n=1 Tax=Fictibacillus sp. NRS-1165 TaxID=3144463 RepID=UPI003D25787B